MSIANDYRTDLSLAQWKAAAAFLKEADGNPYQAEVNIDELVGHGLTKDEATWLTSLMWATYTDESHDEPLGPTDIFGRPIEMHEENIADDLVPVHTIGGKPIDHDTNPGTYGRTHDMDCPGCASTPFTASPRSESYWSS